MEIATEKRPSPWHAGELALQRRVGVAEKMERLGRVVLRPSMPDQHRDFFEHLPSIVIGAVDGDGNVWATMRAGHPGFLSSFDPATLDVAVGRDPSDPAEPGLDDSAAIGLLGLDPATRRRNRLNGTVHRTMAGGFSVQVEQSFGNCPQYISRRAPTFARDPGAPVPLPARTLDGLDERAREMIARSDTFFVATYVDLPGASSGYRRQVDVSHRGGAPGFIHHDDGALVVPDYSGNRFFNTLGNILLNPKAGLLFVDDATGDLLQITGEATVLPEAPDPILFPRAERLWQVRPRRVVHRPGALPLRWQLLGSD